MFSGTGANLAAAARRALAARALPGRAPVWVVVPISDDLEEGHGPLSLFARERTPSLLDALEVLDAAAGDPRVDGVVLRFRGGVSGFSKNQSLRRAVERVRAAGKPAAAYAESLDAPSLMLASAADAVWMPESGSVFLVGLRAESFFLRGLLDRLDVKPEVVRIGDYKSAAERLTRDTMSEEEREQLEELLDDWYGALVEAIASGRSLDPADVRSLIDRGPYTAPAAIEAGLIDRCLYPDEVDDELARLLGGAEPDATHSQTPSPRLVDAFVYHALRPAARRFVPFRRLPRIAYVLAHGAIHRGSGPRGVSSQAFGRLFDKLRRSKDVRAVVLRVASPGGDAIASDLLWRSLSRVANEKPVVVSMGDVAASGGYFLAAAGDAVFAEAGTVTGSIGVVGGKLNLVGLYEKVGVRTDAVERGGRAGLLSSERGFTPDERAAVRSEMSSIYRIFVDRVAEGRGLSAEAVKRAGGGRVWSGVRARTVGLVDHIGGPLEALASARSRAGLDSDDAFRLEHHPRMAPGLRLSSLLRWLPRLETWW